MPDPPGGNFPQVAPHESCVSCFKGDTTTVVAIEGDAEWLIVGLQRATAIPMEQAQQMVLDLAQDEYGCEPGKVPSSRMQMLARLCRDCAAKTGTAVFPVSDALSMEGIQAYRQPDGL